MEVTGKLVSVNRNWLTNKLNITLELNEEPVNEINRIASCEKLNIEIKKFRQKRSLDANGLMWVCLGKIAEAIKSDKWTVYLEMLKRYGKYTYICVKPNVVEDVQRQWRECEIVGEIDINGKKAIQMLCYFGSSTYNTKEFSTLLEGIISEMAEAGLDAPTSQAMQQALAEWEKQYEKHNTEE